MEQTAQLVVTRTFTVPGKAKTKEVCVVVYHTQAGADPDESFVARLGARDGQTKTITWEEFLMDGSIPAQWVGLVEKAFANARKQGKLPKRPTRKIGKAKEKVVAKLKKLIS